MSSLAPRLEWINVSISRLFTIDSWNEWTYLLLERVYADMSFLVKVTVGVCRRNRDVGSRIRWAIFVRHGADSEERLESYKPMRAE